MIDLWQSGHDVADVANKAHIEHPVSFIKDDLRHTTEVGIAMPGEVKKAAWSCNEDIDSAFQGTDLLAHIDATIDNQRTQVCCRDKARHGFLDLNCELTGRSKD